MSGDLTARDAVAETIDEYLFRFHGVTSSLNQADAFMQWLGERGYEVRVRALTQQEPR